MMRLFLLVGLFAVLAACGPFAPAPTSIGAGATPVGTLTLATPTALPGTNATPSAAARVAQILKDLDAVWAKEDWGKAASMLSEAKTLDPTNATVNAKCYAAYYNFGRDLRKAGNVPDAIGMMQKALEFRPDGGEAKQALAEMQAAGQSGGASTPQPSGSVSFIAVTGALPGAVARVSVQAPPRSQCYISFITPANAYDQSKGLESKVADAEGRVAWAWTVNARMARGNGKITVLCGTERISTTIIIPQN
jgi:tetratricopeptide (TPR) repeat protein